MLPYDSVEDYISSTIQSIEFPGWEMDMPQQRRLLGAEQDFRSSKSVKDLFKRDFTITFQLADGFLNYFIFLENAINYLDFTQPEQYFDLMKLGMLNNEGFLVSHIDFRKVVLRGMSNVQLSHSAVSQEFNTFEATFTYNDWRLHLDYGTTETNPPL